MKMIITCLLAVAAIAASAQNAKVYFLRDHQLKGFATSGVINSHLYVNDDKVCTIKNWEYAMFELAPGEHSFTSQFGNSQRSSELRLNIEPGQSYYLMFYPDYQYNNSLIELTKYSGDRLTGKLVREDCTQGKTK